MIIGIDIRVLGSGYKSGITEYTEQLLAHMLPLDSSIQYSLFYSSYSRPLAEYSWLSLENVHLLQMKIPNRILFYASRIIQQPKLDRIVGGADVFFSPHFFLAPLSRRCRRVTTFHDLSFERYPEFFSWRKNIWHRLEMRPDWQARFSDKIIAVSESTQNDLASIYGIDPAKIKVIYSGIAPSMKRPRNEELEYFRAAHDLPRRFILFVGTIEPRKNISGIIRAFDALKTGHEFADAELIIAGPRGWLYEDALALAKQSPHRRNIRFIGQIHDDDRPYYYSLASVFLYPSFFEGFGFPPLEAMACGTPAVVGNTSSLPEIVSDAGLLVDPYNVADIVLACKNILSDADFSATLSKKGLQRAGMFNWDSCAAQTLETLVN